MLPGSLRMMVVAGGVLRTSRLATCVCLGGFPPCAVEPLSAQLTMPFIFVMKSISISEKNLTFIQAMQAVDFIK